MPKVNRFFDLINLLRLHLHIIFSQTPYRRLKTVANQLAYKFHLPNSSCSIAFLFYVNLSVFYVIKWHKSKLGPKRKLLI